MATKKKRIIQQNDNNLAVTYLRYSSHTAGWNPVLTIIALPLIALGIGMIYTLRARIKEIRSGEEDDLNNY